MSSIQSLTSTEINWLNLVKDAAKANTSESRKNLERLASTLSSIHPEVNKVIEAVQKAVTNQFSDLGDLRELTGTVLLSVQIGSPSSEKRPLTPYFFTHRAS